MSVINILHFQVALICLPLRDVSAKVTGWAQQFGFPYFLLLGPFQGVKGGRVSQRYSSCVVLPGSELWLPSLTHNTKLLPFLCSNNIIFRQYKALLSLLRNWEEFMIPIYF